MSSNFLLSIILFFMMPPIFATSNKAEEKVRVAEIPESMGYRISDSRSPVTDVLPTLDVAFQVALPILQARYNKTFEDYDFKGYLANDSIWVIYGNLKQHVEGGSPYIELNKNDGRVVEITHTK